jgi:hypothetical protein
MLRKRLLSLLNRRTMLSVLLFGITFPVFGFLLQIVVKRGIFPVSDPPPTLGFIAAATTLFSLAGFLFAFGFHLFRPALPGRSARSKAFLYGVLIGLGIYFGNIVNFMAFDPAGGADPFSLYKITHIATAVCDLLNFIINGWLLGVVAERFPGPADSGRPVRPFLWRASLAGILIFPVIGFLAWSAWTPVFNVGYLVPAGQEVWFHLVFWTPLALTCGIAVPLMYRIAEPLLSGRWLAKAGTFTLLHFSLYWVTLILFVIPVSGMTWREVLFFTAIGIPAIFFTSLPAAWGSRRE